MLKNDPLYQNELIEKISQIDPRKHYQLGIHYNVKIMIVTDRLHGCAEGLYQCLQCYSDIEVFKIEGLSDIDNVQEIPDIVIVVGYLEKKNTYHKISNLKKRNPYLQSILYGMVDEKIIFEQTTYHIDLVFERTLSVEQLADFIREKMKENIEKRNIDEQNIVMIYNQLCKLPVRSVNILALLYVYDCSTEEIACLTYIHIWNVYRIMETTLEILDTKFPNLKLRKNNDILKKAILKYEMDEINKIEKVLDNIPDQENKTSFENFMNDIKRKGYRLFIYDVKLFIYKIYKKIRRLDKTSSK